MFIIGVFVLFVVLGSYAIWRYAKSVHAREKYGPLMPSDKQLSWKESKSIVPFGLKPLAAAAAATDSGSTSNSDLKITVDLTAHDKDVLEPFLTQGGTLAAATDGAFVGGMMAHAALNIDPQLLHAIQFSTADHLHSLANIDNYVHDHFFAVPIESADGWFERLSGYVAEQKAAAYFEQMGHHVEFAPVANQPIWDMLVDGHPVQIKEGLAGVKEFIVQHPGVDVFAPPDVAGAVKDPAVHALQVLDKDAIHAAVNEGIDNIHGAVSPEFHFPIITLGFSAWREAKLLWYEKTTFERALLHIGMDVAGVGVGGLAGAKLGALIGSIAPGPGTIVGGIIGGVAGAITGKFCATGLRMAPFRAVREDYNNAIENAQSSVNWQIENSKRMVKALQTEYQQKYLAARSEIEREARAQISGVSETFKKDLLLFSDQFPRLLRDLTSQLEQEEKEILDQVPSRDFWGLLFPSEGDLYRAVVRTWFKNARNLVEEEIKTFGAIENRTVDNLYGEVQRFLKEYSFELKSMADELARLAFQFQHAQQEAASIQSVAVDKAENARTSLIEEFGKKVMEVQARIIEEIDSWNSVINGKKSLLKKEAAAVGIDL